MHSLAAEPIVKDGKIEGIRFVNASQKGRHADHNYFFYVDNSKNVIERSKINDTNYKLLFERFKRYGETEALFVPIDDNLSLGVQKDNNQNISPNKVLHTLTDKEKTFTSTGHKLNYHYPIFSKLNDTGYGSIIRATLTLHQKCSSKCPYCSTISREASDCISLEEAQNFVEKLYFDQADYNRKNFPEYNNKYKEINGTDIRLRGLILSGGGQPNLWPHFSKFVEWLSTLDIDLGLITNGFPRNIDEQIYTNFKWVRISITPEDASPHYKNGKFNQQYLPQTLKFNSNTTVGYSYVFGSWTDDDILQRINNSCEDNGFDYCRTLTDCTLERDSQLLSHKQLSQRLLKLGYIDSSGNPTSKIFHQLKYHATNEDMDIIFEEGQCFLQSYNTFWDTTGHDKNKYSYCYPCDSVTVLSSLDKDGNLQTSNRYFDSSQYGTVKNTEVQKLYTEKLKPFFDPKENCRGCLFTKNNEKVKSLINNLNEQEILNTPVPEHVNFP